MNLQELIDQKLKQLYFIELNKDLDFGEVQIQKGLDLPVDQDALKDAVTTLDAGFDMKRILRDICLLMGLDPEFVLNAQYKAILTGMVESPFAYCMHLGIKASEQRMWIEAIGFFKAALQFDAHIDAYFNLGKVHYALYIDDEKGVSDSLKQAKAYFNKAKALEAQPVIDYYLCFIAHLMERHQEALKYAQAAIQNGLDDVYRTDLMSKLNILEDKALYEKGYDLVLQERFQEGLEALLSISESAEDDWKVQFFIGLAYRGLLQYEESMAQLTKALALNPIEDRILNELGIVAMMLGDFTGAKRFFMEGLNLKPLNHDILCNLAILYLEARKLDMARKFIDEAYQIAPEDDIVLSTRQYIEQLETDQKNGPVDKGILQ